MNPLQTREDWAKRLRATAIRALGEPLPTDLPEPERAAFAASFRDDAGHRRPGDGSFLAHLLGLPTPRAHPLDPIHPLWPSEVPLPAGTPEMGGGALLQDDGGGIEARTERELMALHALSWRGLDDPAIRDRVSAAAVWLMEEIQPDNATNHPWGVQVFLDRWLREGDAEAMLYADQMVSACQIHRGRADRLSACILLDAARWLVLVSIRSGG